MYINSSTFANFQENLPSGSFEACASHLKIEVHLQYYM